METKTSISAYREDYERFVALKNTRPQDHNQADTFRHLFEFYELLQQFKPRPMRERKIEQVNSKIIVAGEDTP